MMRIAIKCDYIVYHQFKLLSIKGIQSSLNPLRDLNKIILAQ